MRGVFVSAGEKGEFGRSRFPAKDRVPVRKTAEALDDLDIRVPVATQGIGSIGIARQRFEQGPRAALVVDVLAVMERHVEKSPPDRRNQLVEAAGERAIGGWGGASA